MKLSGLRRLFAVLVGLVLLAGGLLKLNDPVGAGLVVAEYLKWMHLGFLRSLAEPLAVFFALLEAGTGAALLTGVWRRAVAIITSILLGFFTLLTLALLISNPDMDCGCFGEAIHLSHLQSFLKNVVLLALCAAAFIPYRNLGEAPRRKYISFGIIAVSLVAALLWSYLRLPSVDFTAFAPNTELSVSPASDREYDGSQVSYIYEKDGQTASFPLDALPDSTWTFVRVDSPVRGESLLGEPAVSLPFIDKEGEYRDELALRGRVLVISVYNPSRLGERRAARIRETVEAAEANGFTPLVLIAGASPDLAGLEDKVYTADYKTLLTLNRSNGGAVWIDDGTIIRKWSAEDLPDVQELHRLTQKDTLEITVSYLNRGRILAQGFGLYLLALLIFI